jgi:2-polyprenyl-3-methyl-5-hydroxy-6-metoxy-1,4-benzoquinol methylase
MPGLKPLDWPPIDVEVHASEDQLRAMIQRVTKNFEHMGETEPYWSVLSAEQYRVDRIKENEGEFYESGREPVGMFEATATRCGVTLSREMTCLELGCGLGRSTIWLADIFGSVIGADVSRPHLRHAGQTARRLGKRNISFCRVDEPEAISRLPEFDVFFSIIVLQHNPPPIIYRILHNVLSKLKPNGSAYFQVPTYRQSYSFHIAEYLSSENRLGTPEMHVIPQPALYTLFEDLGCHLLEVREDSAAGEGAIVSNRFFVRKA